MAGATPRQLSVEQAKQGLREASKRVGPGYWLKRHPLEALAASLLAGLAIGTSPRTTRQTAKRVLRVLAATLS